MGKQQRLHRTTDDSLRLVRAHLELMVGTTEILWNKLVADGKRNVVVELLIVGALYAFRHVGIVLHLLTCPFLEVGSYLVYLCGTCLCCLLVSNSFSCLAGTITCSASLADSDSLILQRCFYEVCAKDQLLYHLSTHTHSLILLIAGIVWGLHKPRTANIGELNIYVGTLLDIVCVQLWIYPRAT